MTAEDFVPQLSAASIERARNAYAENGLVHIPAAIDPGKAEELRQWMAASAEWSRAINQGDKLFDLGPEAIAALAQDKAKAAALEEAVGAGAREGFQFAFDNIRIAEMAADRSARGLPIDALLDAFNSPAWLDVFRRITRTEAIGFADGQATRYLPGHLLTGHDDDVSGKNRVAAYVFGLTPRWRTEWGGLLTFHAKNGDVERALLPRFNAINLFAVPRLHSVSQVTPFAGAARYSVTGWLRRPG